MRGSPHIVHLDFFLRPGEHAGVTCSDEEGRESSLLGRKKRVVVTSLSTSDAFYNAGLLVGDVILSVDGKESVSHNQLILQVNTATDTAREGGRIVPISLMVERRPPDREDRKGGDDLSILSSSSSLRKSLLSG